MMRQLLLDERILYWVFIPIIYVTLMLNLLRAYFALYTQYTTLKKPIKTKLKLQAHQDAQLVTKCGKLVQRHAFITQEAFNSRLSFICKNQEGYLQKASKNENRVPEGGANNSLMNMNSSLMDGMKGNFMFMATMMPAMAWINHFFAGFVLAKVPFSLTQKFRSMTQSGIDVENLGVKYVSGVSFYFLIMSGLNQLNCLLLDEGDEDIGKRGRNLAQKNQNAMAPAGPAAGPMMNPMGGMSGMAQPGQPAPADNKNRFQAQKDGLQLVQHHFALQNCHKHALSRLKYQLSK